jgi:hypothetical protein
MPREMIVKGKLDVDANATINMPKVSEGYGYRITRFDLWGAQDVLGVGAASEYCGIITAEKSAADASAPNFNNEGQIAVAMWCVSHNLVTNMPAGTSVIDDLFIISQDIILEIKGTASTACNFLIRFEKVKLDTTGQANANYRQFMIFDE